LIFLLLLFWVFGARLAYRCGTRAGLVAPCNKSRLHHPSSSSDSHKVSFLLPFLLSSANVTHTLKRSPVEVAFLSYLLLLSFLTLLNVSIGVAHPINEANVILFFGGGKKS
jgi:hypothetical protein